LPISTTPSSHTPLFDLMKEKISWQFAIVAKIVLSRIPVNYRFWQRVGLFKHGRMEQPDYAYKIFKKHFDRSGIVKRSARFTALELGPGDTVFSAMIAYAYGFTDSYLVDVGSFASSDLHLYQTMESYLQKMGLLLPKIANVSSLDELLAFYGASYLVSGLLSLRTIPDQCVDFVWSHAVLEHIRKAEFLDTMLELRRVIRHDGVISHTIDLRDHLGGALNNLRFSDRCWESNFMAKSGFYTNRIRFSDMLHLFHKSGFQTEIISMNRWDRLPTPRVKLTEEFTSLTDFDLSISGFNVVLRPV